MDNRNKTKYRLFAALEVSNFTEVRLWASPGVECRVSALDGHEGQSAGGGRMKSKVQQDGWLSLIVMARKCREQGEAYLLYRICVIQERSSQLQELRRMWNIGEKKR